MKLIDVDELNKQIESPEYSIYSAGQRAEWIEECIKNAPEIVIPTAKWKKCDYKTFEHGFIETHYGKGIYCTNCRYGFKSAELKMRNFCPSCGAKMDKEGVNNDSKTKM